MCKLTLTLCSLVLSMTTAFAQPQLPSSSFPAQSIVINPAPVIYTTSESGTWVRNYGTNFLGGSVEAHAALESTTANGGSTDALLRLKGIAKFLNQTKEGVNVTVQGHSQTTSNTTGSLNVKVFGSTVYSRNLMVNSTFNWNPSPASVNLPTISIPICTGISVTLGGSLGVDGAVNGGAAIVAASRSINLSGNAEGWAFASATAGITLGTSVVGLTAGVQLTAQFARTTLDLGVSVALTGTTGTLDLSVLPINLALQVFATANFFWWSETTTSDPLVQYTSPAFNANLLSF